MKKIKRFVLAAVMLSLGSFLLISCGTGGGGGGGGSPYSILGEINALRIISIVKDGSINFSNPVMPITGEVVTDATVTLTNETTGNFSTLSYSSSWGGYNVPTNFSVPGNQVSAKIEVDSETITSDTAVTPNPIYTGLSVSAVTIPFTVSWNVSYMSPSYEATRTWIQVVKTTEAEGYQAVIPSSQTSITLTSAEVTAGDYVIAVMGGNPMNLNAASGSVIYTTGGGPAFIFVTIQ